MHLWFGTYGISSFTFAIEHCLNGRKAKSEYMKELALDSVDRNRPLTEEEKQREVDLFFEREKVRRMNWRRSHKPEQGE